MKSTSDHFAPRIYYFHPLLAGARSSWPQHLNRCQDMGFDHVLMAPVFAPGADGDIFLTADHDRVNPAVAHSLAVDQMVEDFARACREHGLSLFLDVVIGELARDTILAQSSPSWFFPENSYPAHVDPDRPAYPLMPPIRASTTRLQPDRLQIGGLCASHALWLPGQPDFVASNLSEFPGHVAADHRWSGEALFGLSVSGVDPGLDWHAVAGLRAAGFAAAFSSLPWWDRRAGGLPKSMNFCATSAQSLPVRKPRSVLVWRAALKTRPTCRQCIGTCYAARPRLATA